MMMMMMMMYTNANHNHFDSHIGSDLDDDIDNGIDNDFDHEINNGTASWPLPPPAAMVSAAQSLQRKATSSTFLPMCLKR
eukprot:1739312-Amphidinium_carterae.1